MLEGERDGEPNHHDRDQPDSNYAEKDGHQVDDQGNDRSRYARYRGDQHPPNPASLRPGEQLPPDKTDSQPVACEGQAGAGEYRHVEVVREEGDVVVDDREEEDEEDSHE